ncbi:hypothetical protein ACWEHT_20190 [Streptomyces sp. NPDC004646]
MQRPHLEALLTAADEAATGALTALHASASYVIWEGTTSSTELAHTYERRLRLTRRNGTETLGLEGAVCLLTQHAGQVRLGRIKSTDGTWVFMLFLTEAGDELVACTGVRQKHP